MINFEDPNKWVILQYRPGSGGKFLCAALMTIDRIAHWDEQVETGKTSYKDWAEKQWHVTGSKWIAYEPLHSWNTRFFSRTFPRGESLSKSEYNKLANQTASEYFKQIWASDRLVLDFLNKSSMPTWWSNAYTLKLDADPNCSLHRKFLLSKIYPYNTDTKMGWFMMDHPLVENPSPNARVYNNQYEFGPFDTQDDWYNFIWEKDFRLNFKMDQPDVVLNDLLSFDKVEHLISTVSQTLGGKFNIDNLNTIWKIWINKNLDILKTVDSDLNNLYNLTITTSTS